MQDPVEQALWLVEAQSIDVVLLDLNLVGGIGLDALQQIKRRRPGTEVVAMASNGTVQSAVRAMKAGIRLPSKTFWHARSEALTRRSQSPTAGEDRKARSLREKQVCTRIWLTYWPNSKDGTALPHYQQGRAKQPLCADPTGERIWPIFVLGRRFSGLVAIQPGHTLVTRGVYGVIRHPPAHSGSRERTRLEWRADGTSSRR